MTTLPTTFVVGTGRTGSTALSRILNLHPDVLSLNELFVSLGGISALRQGPLTGQQFWQLLAQPHPVFNEMVRIGAPLPEFRYSAGRFSAETTGIPAISMMTLPHLTDDPDALFDALAEEVTCWPHREIDAQYMALFTSLATRFGKGVVVERSGHSVGWIPELRSTFPDAKFVHMYRNGPDCALSMSKHNGYRTAALANEILGRTGVRTFAELTDHHIRQLPNELARLCTDGFINGLTTEFPLPIARFGELWSAMVTQGVRSLDAVPEAMRSSLNYDELVHSPRAQLTELARFIGIDADPGWLAAGVSLLTTARSGGSAKLPAEDVAALERACAPGMMAVGR